MDLPALVHVVYQGDAATMRAFGTDFGKGIPVLVGKPIAERLLDPEEHQGFALYEAPQPAEPPAPIAPIAPASAEPVSQAAASEHTPPENKEPAHPEEA